MIAAQSAVLWAHIAAGVLALSAGLVAMATEKGGRRHVRAGRIYVGSMAVVVTTALPLAAVDADYFLFSIAVFSGYLVFTGWRVLARKRPEPGVASPVDWAANLTMVGFGLAMVGLGGADLLDGDGLGVALVVFGAIGLALAGGQVRSIYSPPEDPREWFSRHIVFMGAGYIATVTAAVTVNLVMLPPVLRWVGPTLVGTPLIAVAVARYERRFDSGAEPPSQ
jgi:uncharacterized membrane protein